MYNAIDLKTDSSTVNQLLPKAIVKALKSKLGDHIRIPAVGETQFGYRVRVAVIYETIKQKLPQFAAKLIELSTNYKTNSSRTIKLEECEDVSDLL